MQARETLQFVEPFSSSNEQKRGGSEKERIENSFVETCLTLLQTHSLVLRAEDHLEESGFVSAFEVSLVIVCQDGSYLHMLVFGHSNEGGFLDFGVALEEHDAAKNPLGGYLYSYNSDGLIRTKIAQEVSVEGVEDPHFSLLGLYKDVAELEDLALFGDEEERHYAKKLKTELEEGASLEAWECELGYDGQQPSLQEVHDLRTLLEQAEPRLLLDE